MLVCGTKLKKEPQDWTELEMSGMMLVFSVIILLVCETWTLDPGPSQSPNTSSPAPKVYVVRNEFFHLGSEVNLTGSDKARNEMMFVVWKIDLKHKHCRIAHRNDGNSTDSCKDGKSLKNISRAMYLHIPNFSNDDVGIYRCETIYTGGADAHEINVDIIAPPNISSWYINNRTAVCRAESGKPAANISWSHIQNSSNLKTWTDSDGFFTVESHLELPENMNTTNLSCTIRHPYWKEEKTLIPKFTESQPEQNKAGHQFILIYILLAVIIIAVLAGILFLAQKKLTLLMCCKQTDTSPSKPPPTAEDEEEVEPYASYVQRVNSIYNS